MLVQLADITFGYSGDTLFEGLTWQINEGERIGLVGPNGAGKSTLLRLIAGTAVPETGQVARVRGVSIGYLQQSQEFHGEGTLHDALTAPFAEVLAMRAELEALAPRLDDPAALARYGQLEETIRHLDGYSVEARVDQLAHDVGFGDADLARPVATLSGGEQNRLELAKVLLTAPDLLLLDEPTNHLDLAACERLEAFLANYPRAFVLVSHDRFFLDRVCTQIVDVDDGALETYRGGWSTYVEERAARRERLLAEVTRQKAEIERQEDFIRKNIAGQKTNQAKSRRKMLDKIERLTMTRDMWQDAGRIGLRFDPGETSGKDVLAAEKLAIGYEGQAPIATDIDLAVYRGDRIGIVGPNGAGKSTLLKTLLGKLPPLGGQLRRGTNVRLGYFDQKLADLDESRSLIDEIRHSRGDLGPDQVRQYLAKFRFTGDDVFRVVKGLSGGERNRLTLAKMMLRPANLLALDEPTNHLDIPAREVLERALRHYEGTLLVISHDRFFLDEVCTRLIVIDDRGGVSDWPGNYSDWRRRSAAKVQASKVQVQAPASKPAAPAGKVQAPASKSATPASKSATPASKSATPASKSATPPPPAAAPAKAKADDFNQAKAAKAERQKQERKLQQLEQEIAELERKLAELRAQLAAAHGGDWQKLHGLVEEESDLAERLERRMSEWATLGAKLTGSG